ncbi:MAG: FAD-dependent oxidoreductase, partial [Moraxellaceae bacterium]
LHPERYQITVVSKEPHGSYNRILLSPVLAGEKTFDQIMLNRPEWYAEQGISLKSGVSVQAVNRARREVQLDNGEVLGYERLLLATGSNPFIIPLPNHQHPAVISFRDINDVDTMLANAANCRNVIVIGGGLLGLEAANGLNKRGIKVTVVHDVGYLLNRQLDQAAADLLQGFLEQQGIDFIMNAKTDRIALHDDGTLKGLAFKDGTILDGQLIVMAVGVRPNIQLAKDMGLQVDKAILVNDTLQTSDPRIYAVGECVQHRGALFGLVAPLFEQAKVCANHLAELGFRRFIQKPTATTLKVTGVNLYSAGDFSGVDSDSVLYHDPANAVYKRLFFKNETLVGAVLYGDTQDGVAYFELIQNATPIHAVRDQLMFGVAV